MSRGAEHRFYGRANPGPLACRNISFDHVRLQVDGSGAGAGCSFNNVYGQGDDVFPSSCVPPSALKLDDGGTPPPPVAGLDVQREASEAMEWAAEALRAAERARARAVSTPFG